MQNTQVIGIVGLIGSGKDTVAQYLIKQGGAKESFAKPLKDIVSVLFGWPRELLEGDTDRSREFRETPDMYWTRKLGIDNFTPRLALQLVGTDVLRNHFSESIWLNSLEYRVRGMQPRPSCVVISDARFRNELDLIRNLGGKIIWVQRSELPEWFSIAADANSGNAISKKIMTTKYAGIHASEWDWAGYPVDHVIQNTGTLQDLYKKIEEVKDQMTTKKVLLSVV